MSAGDDDRRLKPPPARATWNPSRRAARGSRATARVDNRQRAEPVHQGSVRGLAGPRSLNVGQPGAAGTRRVRVPMLPFIKVPLGPRAISTVCARCVVSCPKSLCSGVICTSLNQISGSVRLDQRLVDRLEG